MKPPDDDRPHGLCSNIQHTRDLTHWPLLLIADQTYAYAGKASRETVRKSLRRVMNRHFMHWKYAYALAAAWGISETALLHGDFRECTSLEDLQRHWGFDAEAVIERFAKKMDRKEGDDWKGLKYDFTLWLDHLHNTIQVRREHKR